MFVDVRKGRNMEKKCRWEVVREMGVLVWR
jgi:hypothetical protein